MIKHIKTFLLLILFAVPLLPLRAMENNHHSSGKDEGEEVIQSPGVKREYSSDEENDNPAPSKKQKIKSGKEEVSEDEEDYSDGLRQSDIEITDSDSDGGNMPAQDHQLLELPQSFVQLLRGNSPEENLFNNGLSRKQLLERLLQRHYNIHPTQILWLLGYNDYRDDESTTNDNYEDAAVAYSPFCSMLRKGGPRDRSVQTKSLRTDKDDYAKPSLAFLKKYYAAVDKKTAIMLLQDLLYALEQNTDLNNAKDPHVMLYAAHFKHICSQLLSYPLNDQEKKSLAHFFSHFIYVTKPHPMLTYYYGLLKLPATNKLLCTFAKQGHLERLSFILSNNPSVQSTELRIANSYDSIIGGIVENKTYEMLAILKNHGIQLPIKHYMAGETYHGCPDFLLATEAIYQVWRSGIEDLLPKNPETHIPHINTLLHAIAYARQGNMSEIIGLTLLLFPFQQSKYHIAILKQLASIFNVTLLVLSDLPSAADKKCIDVYYDTLMENMRAQLLRRAQYEMLSNASQPDLDDQPSNHLTLREIAKTKFLEQDKQKKSDTKKQQSVPTTISSPTISITTLLRNREMHGLRRQNRQLIYHKNKKSKLLEETTH